MNPYTDFALNSFPNAIYDKLIADISVANGDLVILSSFFDLHDIGADRPPPVTNTIFPPCDAPDGREA